MMPTESPEFLTLTDLKIIWPLIKLPVSFALASCVMFTASLYVYDGAVALNQIINVK